jgi:hypothetical protein
MNAPIETIAVRERYGAVETNGLAGDDMQRLLDSLSGRRRSLDRPAPGAVVPACGRRAPPGFPFWDVLLLLWHPARRVQRAGQPAVPSTVEAQVEVRDHCVCPAGSGLRQGTRVLRPGGTIRN